MSGWMGMVKGMMGSMGGSGGMGGGGGGESIAGAPATYTPVDGGGKIQTRQDRNLQLAQQAPEDDKGSSGGVKLGGVF